MFRSFGLILFLAASNLIWGQSDKPRLIVLADMGNEPDEIQQMAHLLLYSNEFEVEGLIAVTGIHLNPQQTRPYRRELHPELFLELIDGYAAVEENLRNHAEGWPSAGSLRAVVARGQSEYGIEGTGPGKSSAGSDLILNSLARKDPRPLFIVVNAGSNTLAQALIDGEQMYGREKVQDFIGRIRVFENGAQDNAGAWICARYPGIRWIRSNYQTYAYGGPRWGRAEWRSGSRPKGPHTWKPYEYSPLGQHQWALEHIISGHGKIGLLYPLRLSYYSEELIFIEGGGTIPWLGLVHMGLTHLDKPHWGGWSGRFSEDPVPSAWSRHEKVREDERKYGTFAMHIDVSDTWADPVSGVTYSNTYTPVWRWRQAYFNDLKCRMDWCVSGYADANHPPRAAVGGNPAEEITWLTARAGGSIELDASGSTDPDRDSLTYHWWIYPEAGSYEGHVPLEKKNSGRVKMQIPDDARGAHIHLILEVTDQNPVASMSDYRRVVISVD